MSSLVDYGGKRAKIRILVLDRKSSGLPCFPILAILASVGNLFSL